MAVKSVTNDNLMEFVASRQPTTPAMQTPEQVTEAIKGEPKIIEAVGETISTDVDPGNAEPSAKKVKPVQPRIDELTREKKELEEFAEQEYESRLAAERRIVELEAQVKAAKPIEVKPEPELVEPDPKKYTDQELFNKDWKEWNRKVTRAEVRAEFQEQQQREQQRLADELLAARVERARGKFEDFDKLVEAAEKSKRMVPLHVQGVINSSEYGPEIAYHLLKHPKDEARIFKLPPFDALLELGEIAKEYKPKVKEGEEPEPKPAVAKIPQTRAPAPITPLKGNDGVVTADLSKPMDFKDYKRLRLQEQRQNRGR